MVQTQGSIIKLGISHEKILGNTGDKKLIFQDPNITFLLIIFLLNVQNGSYSNY